MPDESVVKSEIRSQSSSKKPIIHRECGMNNRSHVLSIFSVDIVFEFMNPASHKDRYREIVMGTCKGIQDAAQRPTKPI